MQLAPWVLGVLAANWVADISNVVSKVGDGARAFRPEPLTALGAAKAFGWAAGSAVQPGQGINPPWALVPEMTNPFILLALANFLELTLAIVSAVLLKNYLMHAARPLRSGKWLAGAPNVAFVLTVALLWFRLYGPLADLTAIAVRRMPPEYMILVWQVLALMLFAPFMLTAYVMILGRLQVRPAAAASWRLLRDNAGSAGPLFAVGLALFLVQTAVVRLAPATGPTVALGLALGSTLVRVGLGFWLATAWLLWANARFTPARS